MKPAEAAAPEAPDALSGGIAPTALSETAAPAEIEAPAVLPCILLAAGASSRMGRPKLLLSLDGEPVVRRTARIALAHCRPLIVVTGFGRENIEAALTGLDDIVFVHNPDWKEGRVTSVLAGIEALPIDCPGFFLHHADMPFVDETVFAALSRAASLQLAAAGRPVAPNAPVALVALVAGRNGKAGHPVYFPASYIPAIQAKRTGEKLMGVLAALGSLIVETGCDGVLEDMDSPEEYAALAAKYGLSPEAATALGAIAGPEPRPSPGDVAKAKA